MTRYYVRVANELITEFRTTDRMPSSLRVGDVLERDVDQANGWTLVEVEDDNAPPELAGCVVDLVFQVAEHQIAMRVLSREVIEGASRG